MQINTFNVLFFIRKTKLLRNGEAPVYVRITVNGDRGELGISRSINPEIWDSGKGRAKGNTRVVKEFNEYLDEYHSRVFQAKKKLESDFRQVTSEALKMKLLGIDEQNYYFLEVFKDHNEKLRKMGDREVAPGTIERYETAYKHLQEFIRHQYKLEDYLFRDVNYSFIKNFEFFLKTERKCAHNTTVKYIVNIKKIIRIAMANDWIKQDPFKDIRYRYDDVEAVYLTDDDLAAIVNKEIDLPRIDQVRDVFLFCCFTGLAFSDVKGLKKDNIIIGIDGKQWIQKRRTKTNVLSNIPLLDMPKRILEKYSGHDKVKTGQALLPVPSNQKMNAYLKEIADLCGINKKLTTHAARHTFATTVTLSNHVSMESVSKMLGHTSINMTRKYARIADRLISEDMQKLEGKYNFDKACEPRE
ncbi:MAG: site-specific integrase [Bacteroidales bacterium]|nr:site-specific integrase [Bacteroidales bacterium]